MFSHLKKLCDIKQLCRVQISKTKLIHKKKAAGNKFFGFANYLQVLTKFCELIWLSFVN